MVLSQAKGEERMKETILSTSIAILSGLNLVDWVMTDYALAHGAYEQNPMSKWLIDNGIFDEIKCLMFVLLVASFSYTRYAEKEGYFKDYMGAYSLFFGVVMVTLCLYTAVTIKNVAALAETIFTTT